jgi:hypothetical protein
MKTFPFTQISLQSRIPPRIKIICARWLDIFILTTVACLIYFLSSPFIEPRVSKFIATIGIYPLPLLWLIYSLILALLWWPVVRYGGFSVRGYLKYPPFWFACIIGTLIIWIFQQYNSDFSNWNATQDSLDALFGAFGTMATGVIASAICFKIINHTFERKRNFKDAEKIEEKPLTDNIESLLQWIKEETPIETPFQDRLNTKITADRIAEVLRQSPLNTISVVGGYGTGKSSILHMVQHYLKSNGADKKQNNSLILVDVCGWGLQKGTAAETILKQVVQGCSEHVDCFGLSNLPAQYAASIGAISGWSKALSSLISISYDPMTALERMDSILLAINKKVIIFFEDLDRNWQGNDFWVEIISLLDRLKKLTRVSFVLAITDTSKMSDIINRISDHVEFIPKLSVEHFAEIYEPFRDHCLQTFDDIPLELEETRYRRITVVNIKERDKVGKQMGVLINDEADKIATLIETPRNLKHALRRTYEAWQSPNGLHGEIEFDALFIANAIRVSELGVFNFIHENISDIRWLDRQGIKQEEGQKERTTLKEKLANVTESPSRQEAVEILLKFLFPYWKDSPIYTNAAIQGFSKKDPTDYWERMVREKLDDEEISDQELARAIINWKDNKNDLPVYKNLRLVQAVNEINGFPDKLEQLGELLLDTQQVHKLTGQLFQIVYREKGLKDEYFPGRNELNKLMSSIELKRSFSSKEDLVSPFNHFTWLVEEVNKLFPYSLLIAAGVYNYWFLWNALDPSYTEDRNTAYRTVLEKAKSCYSDNNTFINAIKADDNAVSEFIRALLSKRRNDPQIDPNDWRWLKDLLINNMGTNYSIIVPQILEEFVIQENFPNGPWRLISKRLQAFFQEKNKDVMMLLSKLDTNQFTGKRKLMAEAARKQATEWLNETKELTNKD